MDITNVIDGLDVGQDTIIKVMGVGGGGCNAVQMNYITTSSPFVLIVYVLCNDSYIVPFLKFCN